MATCPKCQAEVAGDSNFCEECGAPLSDAAAATPPGLPRVLMTESANESAPMDDLGSGPISQATSNWSQAPAVDATTEVRPCASCGGSVGPDLYCEQCGVKALSPRDHFREQPAAWVAGVCDKGIRHGRNEDALALSATADGTLAARRAVLVVLDGVSNTDDSQVGSLAGARSALASLSVPMPKGLGTPESALGAATKSMTAAIEAAQAKVVEAAPADAENPASATFCAAVLEGDTLTYANVGDSRIYWLPDTSEGAQLSIDHSAAQDQIAAGVPRVEAESGPYAHAITKWLGRDSEDRTPHVGQLTLSEPGWLLVCSDGLWNYASEPASLTDQIRAAGTGDPAALALALTEFANGKGGQDNISAALARVDLLSADPVPVQNAPIATDPKEQPHG